MDPLAESNGSSNQATGVDHPEKEVVVDSDSSSTNDGRENENQEAIVEKEEVVEAEVPQIVPQNREEFYQHLKSLKIGSRQFLDFYGKYEEKYVCNEGLIPVVECETEEDFEEKRDHLNKIYLIKNGITRNGSGLSIPEDFNFETVKNYLNDSNDKNKKFWMINSLEQRTEKMTIRTLIKKMNTYQNQEEIWNLLSLEFSRWRSKLRDQFRLPAMVKSECMISRLENALKKKKEELAADTRKDQASLNKMKEFVDRQLREIPKYHKFVLISMAGSFTDIHVDFSGTAVYYHVVKGRKIFYVAKDTEENMNEYQKQERGEAGQWLGATLSDQWQRIVIEEGNTAILPPGYIHFVYTPMHSLVIGGNYLHANHLKTHFAQSKLDGEAVLAGRMERDNTYIGFKNSMFSYVENVFIREIKELKLQRMNNFADAQKPIAQQFYIGLKELSEVAPDETDWYTVKEQQNILKNLHSEFKSIKTRAPYGMKAGQKRKADTTGDEPSTSK
uniref:JmjC domain-containing protein n=1 Tax=Caenorhabditis tropicalis TaxID=1561998 RepID=A0A1I7U0P4_9PELO